MRKNINIYTDLAIESREMLEEEDSELEGIAVSVEETENSDTTVTCVRITNETGERLMKKPIGSYFTIESQIMKCNDLETHKEISDLLAEKIKYLADIKEGDAVLIIGLGNWNVTPDALGPKVIKKVLVTRHIAEAGALPPELHGARPVCAFSPGVMGITGIETAEIVKGVVQRVKPKLVIAIDALAARQTNRINSTIQMSDTGVNPGAGMGNKRTSINEKTLGVPVVAIGVPTVVDAATLVNDTMDIMIDAIIEQTEAGAEFYDMLKHLEHEEKYNLIMRSLEPFSGNMFVTPKEVDATVERLSGMIADALNKALHPNISPGDILRFLY